jgi:predicted ArsR family transcriptional regulator
MLDLIAAGDATATTLAARLPVTRQAVAKHLTVLDRAGLVVGHRHGRELRYAVQARTLRSTAQWMAALASQWDERLDTIRRLAES